MFLICLGIGFIIGVWLLFTEIRDYGDFGQGLCYLFGVSLVAFLIGILLTLIGCVFADCSPSEPYGEPETIELMALKDGDEIFGSFFLGSGMVEEDQYYYYLIETPKGIQQQKTLVDENVFLHYIENGETPRLEKQTMRTSNKFLLFWTCGADTYTESHFYIPKGSLTTEFEIDLE